MTTEPKGRRTASSGPRGMNLQQKMDDARARRAEKLSHSPPANDDARVPTAPKAMAKNAPDTNVQKRPEPKPALAPSEPPNSQARFPEIVMPPAPESPLDAEKPRRRLAWLFPMVGLLLALILGALYVVPENVARTPALSEIEPLVPAQVTDEEQEASASDLDVRPELAQTGEAIPPPNTNAAALPLLETTSTPPNTFIVAAFDPLSFLAETTPTLPAILPVLTATRPASLFAPARDAAFTPPNEPTPQQAKDLTVSLIIPDFADAADVIAVSTALDETGFTIRDPRRVSYVVRQTQVRYFHEADAASAAVLADTIGGALRDFTDYAPSPPEGLVEVFIAGRAPAAASRPEPRGLAGDLRQLGTNVRDALNAITR